MRYSRPIRPGSSNKGTGICVYVSTMAQKGQADFNSIIFLSKLKLINSQYIDNNKRQERKIQRETH